MVINSLSLSLSLRAMHTPTGRIMVIKAIDVRDKSKCDQVRVCMCMCVGGGGGGG